MEPSSRSADEVVTCEKAGRSFVGGVAPRSSFAAQMGEDGREMPMGRRRPKKLHSSPGSLFRKVKPEPELE